MSNGNKEILLSVRDPQGDWSIVQETVKGRVQTKEFRTEASAQRDGSILLKEGSIDAYKVFKLMSMHH